MVSWWPETRLEWIFFLTTAIQAVTNTTIQVTVLIVYLNWVNPVVYQVQRAFVTPLTLGISSLGVIYQMILTLDAYRIKNHIQIFVQCAANVCLAISSVMQYNELKDSTAQLITDEDQYHTPLVKVDWPFWKKVSPGLMVCTIQTCICSLVMCGLAPGLYREFSWALYQHVSPDKKIQNKYFVYQVYLVLLKYTPYFFFAFIFIYAFIDVHFAQPEFSLAIAIMPASLVHVAIAVYSVRHERRFVMAFALLCHAAGIVYLITRLVILYGPSRLANTLMKDQMVFYACVGLGFAVTTLMAGCVCFWNFNKGLKPLLLGQVQRKIRLNEVETDYYVQRLNYNIVPLADRDSQRFALD